MPSPHLHAAPSSSLFAFALASAPPAAKIEDKYKRIAQQLEQEGRDVSELEDTKASELRQWDSAVKVVVVAKVRGWVGAGVRGQVHEHGAVVLHILPARNHTVCEPRGELFCESV